MDSELIRELGGAKIRLLEILSHRYEGIGMGGWSQLPYVTIVWVKTGRLITFFDDAARKPLLREAGSVVFHPANLKKRSKFISGPYTEFVIIGLSVETASGFNLMSLMDIPHVFPEAAAAELRVLMSRLMELNFDFAHPAAADDIIEVKMVSLSILRLLLRSAKMRQDSTALSRAGRLRPIIDELSRKFNKDLRIDRLADRACLSTPQFYRQFKSVTGFPPLEYVIQLRLREASRLLLNTDESILAISERVGWKSQFHFSRIFKAAYGISPLKYRNSAKSRVEMLA